MSANVQFASEAASISEYSQQVKAIPQCTDEENSELAKAYKTGSLKARRRLIEGNLRLVLSIAVKYVGRGVNLPDLINEGNMGLMHAISMFDPEIGIRLSTYAFNWIKCYIRKYIADQSHTVRIPVHLYKFIKQWNETKALLTEKYGYEPSNTNIAEHLNLTPKKARAIISAIQSISGTVPIISPKKSDESQAKYELAGKHNDTLSDMIQTEEINTIQSRMQKLNTKEQTVITLRYCNDEQTLQEIGDQLGVTRERVRQLERDAIKKLAIGVR